jgi:hypothetical protein
MRSDVDAYQERDDVSCGKDDQPEFYGCGDKADEEGDDLSDTKISTGRVESRGHDDQLGVPMRNSPPHVLSRQTHSEENQREVSYLFAEFLTFVVLYTRKPKGDQYPRLGHSGFDR